MFLSAMWSSFAHEGGAMLGTATSWPWTLVSADALTVPALLPT